MRGSRPSSSPGTIVGFVTFDESVLCRPLVELHEKLHARVYLYELSLTPSGMSFYRLDAENEAEESIFVWIRVAENHNFKRQAFFPMVLYIISDDP